MIYISFLEKKPLHNPERVIAPGTKIKNLNGKTFNDIIDCFEGRIKAFYFNPCERLLYARRRKKKKSDSGFAIISISFTILDLLSQYYNGALSSDWIYFEKFMIKYLSIFNSKCKGLGLLYHRDDLSQKGTLSNNKNLIWVLWFGYRHGIIHNGKTMSYVQYNFFQSDLYQEKRWIDSNKDNRYEFWLNPIKFFEEVRNGYDSYINDLRISTRSMSINQSFRKKFESDFGYG